MAAIVAGVGFPMVAIVVGIPYVVGGGAYLVASLVGGGTALWAALWAVLWAVAVLYGIAVAVVGVTVVQVPISSSLRYYSLLVLADVSPSFDLVYGVRSYLDDVEDSAVAGVDGGDGDDGGPPPLEESGSGAGAGTDAPETGRPGSEGSGPPGSRTSKPGHEPGTDSLGDDCPGTDRRD